MPAWHAGRNPSILAGLILAFALAVTASVQVVGVYLVFSSLIIPALATRALRGRRQYAAAWFIGVAGYAIGLGLSALFDLPSGAIIVWALAGCALLAAVATSYSKTIVGQNR